MNAAASTNRLDRPELTLRTIEPAQHTAAKVAGFFYLVTAAMAFFAEFIVRSRLIVADDAVRTASNIAANEQLFRVSIVCDLFMAAGVVILNLALYRILAPTHRSLALLAASWRMFEVAVHATITVSSFVVLRLLSGVDYLQSFEPHQLEALARLFLSAHGSGYYVALLFFGLGSTTYFYLLVRSRYVPGLVALLGLAGSALTLLVVFAQMLFPAGLAAAVAAVRTLPPIPLVLLAMVFAPVLAFEIILGSWLLVKGIRIREHDPQGQ